ncbi:hypothetical protein SAMN05421780_11087 [Flexibacter flexilis DSM 6793]|uniref:Uncharacterized protein n=1 Tax=Flexibacter flexilis DSM 6793 TaxID=927664 RepID=A0A1I1MAU8_9BACT|nr:hypothetical protein SAMN05421780_11087 [Flexibacter flexilis DSM 6793]
MYSIFVILVVEDRLQCGIIILAYRINRHKIECYNSYVKQKSAKIQEVKE